MALSFPSYHIGQESTLDFERRYIIVWYASGNKSIIVLSIDQSARPFSYFLLSCPCFSLYISGYPSSLCPLENIFLSGSANCNDGLRSPEIVPSESNDHLCCSFWNATLHENSTQRSATCLIYGAPGLVTAYYKYLSRSREWCVWCISLWMVIFFSEIRSEAPNSCLGIALSIQTIVAVFSNVRLVRSVQLWKPILFEQTRDNL